MICSKCGSETTEHMNFCIKCGEALKPADEMLIPERQNQTETNPVADENKKTSLTEVLTLKDFIIMQLLMMIPIANYIFLFMWGFSDNQNLNKKHFAQSQLIMIAVSFIIGMLFMVLYFVLIFVIMVTVNNY